MNILFVASTSACGGEAVHFCLHIALTAFTEAVTASKYPSYHAYQKRVGLFTPVPDTLLRALYYRWIASPEARHAVEEEV